MRNLDEKNKLEWHGIHEVIVTHEMMGMGIMLRMLSDASASS